MKTNSSQEKKHPYEKPTLRRVDLATEEVMAVGCKTASAPGAPKPPSCPAGGCRRAGS